MNRDFLRTLGGVSRFLEVSKDPNSTPRDRLLAKRTWRHRKLLTLSEFADFTSDLDEVKATTVYRVDEQVGVLNTLRLNDTPDLASIESAYNTILDLLLKKPE